MVERLGLDAKDNRYARLLQIAISGLREMSYTMDTSKTTKVLPVNSNDTVDLPYDYIRYIRIGVCRNGKIVSLGLNPKICPMIYDDCGNPEVPKGNKKTNLDKAFVDRNHMSTSMYFNRRMEFTGGVYNARGGQNKLGEYKVIEDDGIIALQGFTGDEVILEYYADIEKVEGKFLVHPYDTETLKDWIWWKYIQNNKTVGTGVKREAERMYYNSLRKSRSNHRRFNIQELMKFYRKGFSSSPKI